MAGKEVAEYFALDTLAPCLDLYLSETQVSPHSLALCTRSCPLSLGGILSLSGGQPSLRSRPLRRGHLLVRGRRRNGRRLPVRRRGLLRVRLHRLRGSFCLRRRVAVVRGWRRGCRGQQGSRRLRLRVLIVLRGRRGVALGRVDLPFVFLGLGSVIGASGRIGGVRRGGMGRVLARGLLRL